MKDTLLDFLKNGYERWRRAELDSGSAISDVTETAFARYLGISHTNWSRYANGPIKPTGDNLQRMAAYYGPKLYDLVGQPRPMPVDPDLYYIAERWPHIEAATRRRLLEWFQKEEKGDPKPAALKIASA